MRKETTKVLFLGAAPVKDKFFKRAQKVSAIQFADESMPLSDELVLFLHALKTLRSLSHKLEPKEGGTAKSGRALARLVVDTEARWEELKAREKLLKIEESRTAVFGEFSLKDVSFIQDHSDLEIRYFCARPSHIIREEPALWFIGSDVEWDYFVTLKQEIPKISGLIEIRITRPLSAVKNELKAVRADIKACQEELHRLVACRPELQKAALKAANQDSLSRAEDSAKSDLDDRLFIASAYCDVDDIDQFAHWFEGLGIYYEEIEAEGNERLPTILKNEGMGAVGQDVIEVYDTPSLDDQDPSLWVLWAFALFFALIVSDAGYGLCLLLGTLFLRKRIKSPSAGLKRFWKLMTLLSTTTIIWGVVTASYFGIDFAPNSPVQRTSVMYWMVKKKVAYHIAHKGEVYQEWKRLYPQIAGLSNAEDVLMSAQKKLPGGRVSYEMHTEFAQNLLMELAIFIGLVHVILSLMRYAGRSPSAIGWIFFLIGGYLYLPGMIQATSAVSFLFGFSTATTAPIGLGCLIGGVVVATILSLYRNKWSGLAEPMTALQLFADVLSYLRLYALALAGMILAATFNDLGLRMNPWFGVPVIVFGHLINLTMAVLAAVIHGLRLNFLESYHYCFEGGGKIFKPLRRLEDGY